MCTGCQSLKCQPCARRRVRNRAHKRASSGGFFDFFGEVLGVDNYPQHLGLRRWWRDFPGSMPWPGTPSFGGISGTASFTSSPGSYPVTQGPTLNFRRKTMLPVATTDSRVQGGGSLYDVFGGGDWSGWLLMRTRVFPGSYGQILGAENGVFGGPYGLWCYNQFDGSLVWTRELGGLTVRTNGGAWSGGQSANSGSWALIQFRCSGGTPYAPTGIGASMFRLGGATGNPAGQVLQASDTDYAEFATAPYVLTDAQFDRVRRYCNARYGVSV